MTEQEAHQEHIRYTHDTYCRIDIRHASFGTARMLAARWKREISLEYLTEEKFVPLSTTVQFNYHISVDGMLYSVPYEYIKKKVDVKENGIYMIGMSNIHSLYATHIRRRIFHHSLSFKY